MSTNSNLTSNSKPEVILINDFDISKLSFIEDTKELSKNQKMLFPRYINKNSKSTQLMIQLEKINISMYGIPDFNEAYHKDEQARAHLRLPLDENIPKIKKICDVFKKMDDFYGSDEYKNKLFPGKKKYEYQPIYRLPEEEEPDKVSKYGKKLPYIKLKLALNYPSNEVITGVMVKENNKFISIDNIVTVNDICKYIKFRSDITPIIQLSKLWYNPPTIKNPQYGIVFKLIKAKVVVPENTTESMKHFMEDTSGFIDEEEEEEKVIPVQTIINKEKSKDEDDEEEEEEEDDNEEDNESQ